MQVPQIKVERSPRTNLVRNGIIYVCWSWPSAWRCPPPKDWILRSDAAGGLRLPGNRIRRTGRRAGLRERPASFGQAVRWIVRAVLFGELMAVAMLASADRHGLLDAVAAAFFPPDLETLATRCVLGWPLAWRWRRWPHGSRSSFRRALRVWLCAWFFSDCWLCFTCADDGCPDVEPIGMLICSDGRGGVPDASCGALLSEAPA